MAAIEYFRTAIKHYHTRLSDAVKDLNESQFYFRLMDKGSPIYLSGLKIFPKIIVILPHSKSNS